MKILSGVLRPGDRFEGEIEGAGALGVSRTPYREAIRILVAKGLLESRPRAGTHITERSRWNLLDPDILAWAFSGEPDERFIADLFELRAIIEPAAAALAAARRTDAQARAMRAALEVMRAQGLSTEGGQAADKEFHDLILQATGNAGLAVLSSSIGAAVMWTTRFKQRSQPLPRDPVPEHDMVCRAIEAQDPAKARAAMDHLLAMALRDTALTPP